MNPSRDEQEHFLHVALAAAEKADGFIKDKTARGFTTKTKDDGSFVTKPRAVLSVERDVSGILKHIMSGKDL